VIAVVTQRSEKVRRYIEDTGLPFNILVDDERVVVKLYGVWHRIGLDAWDIARPAVFLVDRDATIRYLFVAGRQDEFPTPDELLEAATRVDAGGNPGGLPSDAGGGA